MKSKYFNRFIFALFAILIAVIIIISGYSRIYGTDGVKLPVLIYHNFAADSSDPYTVSAVRFNEQMQCLKRAGYSSVSLQQVIDYVENGSGLPSNPILITIDDGYESNLSVAAPILEKHGMCATIFMVGKHENAAKDPYADKMHATRYFSYENAKKWVDKGILDVQSHTYDMHNLVSYGVSKRDGMLSYKYESKEEYFKAVKFDHELFCQKRDGRINTELVALAYPYGFYTDELDEYLSEQGVRITFTTQEHINTIKPGYEDSLRKLGRINVVDSTSGNILVLRLLKNRIF